MSIVSDEEATRFVEQVVRATGSEGMSEESLRAAFDEFTDMVLTAAAYALWQEGKLTFGWDDSSHDLTYTVSETS